MTPEKQRIAIAIFCGWKFWHDDHETLLLRPDEDWPSYPHWKERGMVPGDGRPNLPIKDLSVPAYHRDLNAMHEAEKTLDDAPGRFNEWCKYWEILETVTCRTFDKDIADDCKSMLHATAAQRAEAFLRTIGKWKD